MKLKRVFCCIVMIGAMLIFGSLAAMAANMESPVEKFKDIDTKAWYIDDVEYVYENGIMNGMSDTMFGPNLAVTRGQFVTMLGRLVEIDDSSLESPQNTIFSDVKPTSYYASHIAWATEYGIVNGMSSTTFAPEQKVTREQMATMMARFSKVFQIYIPTKADTAFADDAAISKYAKEAVYGLKNIGILDGVGKNIFDPKGATTRAAAAKVMHYYMEYEPADTAVVSIEKFTLGQGYILEPTVVPLNNEATADSVLRAAAKEVGIDLKFHEKSGYLTFVKDECTAPLKIPDFIVDEMAKAEVTVDNRADDAWLGEYDYTAQAGWLYWHNNATASTTANQCAVSDGDVVRFQFSISGWGADLGRSDAWTVAYRESANKDELMKAVAWANDTQSEAYANALKVLTNIESSQEAVDAALAAMPLLAD